jgi:hypothetical protein
MFLDEFWAYDRLILLNNIVFDAIGVHLLHILSDYVNCPFQFENKHSMKVVSRSIWRHQNGVVWCPSLYAGIPNATPKMTLKQQATS